MIAKYVIFKTLDGTRHLMMLGEPSAHARFLPESATVLSAGFVNLETFECYGRSVSLHSISKIGDTQIIMQHLGAVKP
jgi:hypothetical protein